MASPLSVSDVFIPGGMPTITYIPRSELHLEQRVEDYLDERHRILSLSGPTKTGKTVLLKNRLTDPIWLSGGAIESMSTFWEQAADKLALFTKESVSDGDTSSESEQREGRGSLAAVSGSIGQTEAVSRTRTDSRSRSRALPNLVREALAGGLYPLVIDDFHYIDPKVQLTIVRNVKDLVFDGVPVILAAVPHRAYDAVRVEKEMTGRVEQLPIPFWERNELVGIARAGFAALNVNDDGDILADRLAHESFQSPHLMQDHCRGLCKANDIRRVLVDPEALTAPDWDEFFAERATTTSKSTFDRLARGPRQRSDRKARQLIDGRTVDIYGAVLAAIAHTGPLTELTYEQLRAALREMMKSDPPQRHEVTNVLEQMSRIGRDEIEGEPVLDYDSDMSKLHISDPFFAYYLRWGSTESTAL